MSTADKKAYAPGELFYLAFSIPTPVGVGVQPWILKNNSQKDYWKRREEEFFRLLSTEMKLDEVDEQTDDSSGITTVCST